MMYLEQIDHVALRCASLETTKNWYVSTLGFEHVFPGRGSGVPIILRLGSTLLTLFPAPPCRSGPALLVNCGRFQTTGHHGRGETV